MIVMPETGFGLSAAARQEMIDEGFNPYFPPGVDEQLVALKARAARVSRFFQLVPTRATLQLENRALRHQIGALRRSAKKRPKLPAADRVLRVWLCGVWHDWRSALVIVKPGTVMAWHRQGLRLFWTWKVRLRRGRTRSPQSRSRLAACLRAAL